MNLTRNKKDRWVRAKVMRQCKVHQKYFTLKEYGSWRKAETAATAWLETTLPTLPPPVAREGRMTKKNNSGVVGVYRSSGTIRNRDGKTYNCSRWVARWPGCPFRGGLSWSVKEFGEEGAFALAVIARELRTVNRDRVMDYLERIVDTPRFDQIWARRR